MNPERITILVVAHEPDIAQGTSRVLEKAGYATAVALNGTKAREAIRANRPDIVLLDRDMPDRDGMEICCQIKRDPACTDIFVILISGTCTRPEEQVNGLESGADGYLVRPLGNSELVARLETFVRVLRLTRSLREQARVLQASNEDLRQSEERLQLALDASKAGSWSWDVARNKVLTWGVRYRTLYGFEPEEPASRETWLARVHPEDRQRLQARLAALLKPGADDVWTEEFRVLHPVQGERWVAELGRVQRDTSGRDVRFAGICLDITERMHLEEEREISVRLLGLINAPNSLHELMQEVTLLLREWFGCEAVGVRLAQGADFPYFETRGFPAEFVRAESPLCLRDASGQPVCGGDGNAVLECMCGHVLCGRFNPAKPFFTARGSFWTNSTTDLLASTTGADRQTRTRNRCHGEGYESVALVALRSGQTMHGLLQLNDKRKDRFTPKRLALIERLADNLAIGLAQRQTQNALRESEERFKKLFVEAPLGVALIDSLTGHIHEVNPMFAKIIGRTMEEIADIDWMSITHPDDVQKDLDNMALLNAGKISGFQTEKRYLHHDGTSVWINMTIAPIHVEDRTRPRHLCMIKDITERKRVEAALQEKERLLSESQRIAHIGGWSWAFTGPIQWTDETYRLYGVSPETFTPTLEALVNLVHPEDRPMMQEWVRACGAGEKPAELEFRCVWPDGTVRFLSGRGERINDAENRPTHIFGTVQNITERKQAEAEKEKLEAQNRALQKAESLGRMAGAIAHHFNNQLAAVIGNLDLLKDGLPGDGESAEYLSGAMGSAHKAAEMSGLMLTYLGQTHGKREPQDLSDLCRRHLPLLQAVMPKIVSLETTLPASGPVIKANANQIQQVLTNLLSNAWEACGKERGKITLAVQTVSAKDIPATKRFPLDWQPQDTPCACLAISDTGSGIAAGEIEKVFDPFYSTRFAGRGLGLAVVLGITRGHGGCVTLESEPGRGSVFRVYLPVTTEAMPQKPAAASAAPETSSPDIS